MNVVTSFPGCRAWLRCAVVSIDVLLAFRLRKGKLLINAKALKLFLINVCVIDNMSTELMISTL